MHMYLEIGKALLNTISRIGEHPLVVTHVQIDNQFMAAKYCALITL